MAEIIAIAGLVYLGKMMSEPKKNVETYEQKTSPPTVVNPDVPVTDVSMLRMFQRKSEIPNFGDVAPQMRSSGGEVLEMKDRVADWDAGRMNNLSPVEKHLVGPGLGVGANVPAFGGYQQLLRVNPENVGAYRLTSLPGRSGPPVDYKGGRRSNVGEVAHNRPEKTAYLPTRRPETFGRAQGVVGLTSRGEHEKTKRLTNRSVTGQRDDGLNFPGAKRIVSTPTLSQDPTRNKKDGNIEQYQYNNHPVPNVNSFAHGYENSPANKIGEKRVYGTPHTVEELMAYGFRPDDRRGKANRQGNAGRMNVRAGPLNQGGMPTATRIDTTRIDGRLSPVNGASTQNYVNNSLYNFNPYKGNQNPYATDDSLAVAKKQMDKNPVAQKLY